MDKQRFFKNMVQTSNKQLLEYWNNVRADRRAPKRVEITPSAISNILPVTFILERNKQHHYNFRLAGSRMCEIFGKEFRGTNFIDGWPKQEHPILRKYLSQLVDEGAVIIMNFTARSKSNHIGEFEIIFLPITHCGTTIDRVLGAISPIGDYPWIGATTLEFDEIQQVTITLFRNPALTLIAQDTTSNLTFIPHKRLVEGKNCQLRVFDGGLSD